MAELIAFFAKVGELHACYKAVKGSKEKDSVKGKSGTQGVFCEKLLKSLQYKQENTCTGIYF